MNAQEPANVEYSIADDITVRRKTGVLVEISDIGIGMLTDMFLEPGSIIRFRNTVRDSDSGVVMWTVKTTDNYHVGIRFIRRKSYTA